MGINLTSWFKRDNESNGTMVWLRTYATADQQDRPVAEGGPDRIRAIAVSALDETVTLGVTVTLPGGRACDYWLSVRQLAGSGEVSVRAWREPGKAPEGEEIIVQNPNPGWSTR